MSFGHCLGMCGPIAAAFALAQAPSGASRWRLLPPLALYNAGRVTAYSAIGVAAGLAGALFASVGGARAAVSLAAGILVFAAGLALAGILPATRWLEASPLGSAVSRAIRSLIGSRSTLGNYALGVANGFLPCGPVAAAALAAAGAGGALRGAAAMAAYGAGTVPAMLALGLGASALGAGARARLQRVGAVLVVLLGAQLVLRGLHGFGLLGTGELGPLVLW